MEKVNYPEYSLFYVNQAFLTVQKSKRLIYGEHFILGQVIEVVNIPNHIETYECFADEVKMYRPENDVATGQFLGLYKTVGLMVVRGDDDDTFFNYGFDKEKSKLLYLY